jgi:hypothetical protein
MVSSIYSFGGNAPSGIGMNLIGGGVGNPKNMMIGGVGQSSPFLGGG